MSDDAKIGPYTVLRRLGMGGTSEVLLAASRGPFGFVRVVVIKRLLPRYRVDPLMARMLAHEAVAYSRLTHPAIVRLYDFLSEDGELALVLEYVDGVTLARLRSALRGRGQRLGDDAAYYVARRIFAALEAAHDARDPKTGEPAPVIHRDVSPGNVLIPLDGFVKLADFGIAKVSGTPSDTQDGLIKGTDGYMAPEQVTGAPITTATDVYAACLILRELLVGAPAFTRGRTSELDFLRVMADPKIEHIQALRPGVPKLVADALERGLRADPAARDLTATEMLDVLSQLGSAEDGRLALTRAVALVVASATPGEATPRGAIAVEPPGPRAPSEPSVRAQVMETPYAYVPSRGTTTLRGPSCLQRAGIPAWGAVVVAMSVVILVTCGVASRAWKPPARAPAHASATGEIAFATARAPRTVYVDGRSAGRTTAPIVVPCGHHQVKAGFWTFARDVDVPCGGRIELR